MLWAVTNTEAAGTISAGAMIEQIITAREDQQTELEQVLGYRLLQAAQLGLVMGDMYNGAAWTRNIDGEQVALPIDTPSQDADIIFAILEGRDQ